MVTNIPRYNVVLWYCGNLYICRPSLASQPYFLRARMRVIISRWSHARSSRLVSVPDPTHYARKGLVRTWCRGGCAQLKYVSLSGDFLIEKNIVGLPQRRTASSQRARYVGLHSIDIIKVSYKHLQNIRYIAR